MPFALDVECWTLNCQLANPFGVERFLSPFGRVAESGLRHSTRNRAWGNPPWVRIPPLPPVRIFEDARSVHILADMKALHLISFLCGVLLMFGFSNLRGSDEESSHNVY